jgi:hypothetical protein
MSDQLVALLNLRQRISTLGSGGGGGGGDVTVAQFNALRNAVAQLDLLTPRVKIHPIQTATEGQTVFTLPDPFSVSTGQLFVYSGGVLVDTYTLTSPTEITFTSGREDGEKIRVVEVQLGSDTGTTVVDGITATGSVTSADFEALVAAVALLDRLTARVKTFSFSATAGQTVFTLPETYEVGQNALLVFSGGVLVDTYTETSPAQITFTSARELGENIQIIKVQLGAAAGVTVVDGFTLGPAITAETPTGLITSTDGTNGNGTFTVAFPVDAAITPRVLVSGLELSPVMFSRTGQTFVVNAPYKPVIGETVSILYKRSS